MYKESVPSVYRFDPTHKGANKYQNPVTGVWYNAGHAVEAAFKCAFCGYNVNDCTGDRAKFETRADCYGKSGVGYGVKSYRANLGYYRPEGGESKEGQVEYFLRTDAANMYVWGVQVDEEVVCYIMTRDEFSEFLHSKCWVWVQADMMVKQRSLPTVTIAWLEGHLD